MSRSGLLVSLLAGSGGGTPLAAIITSIDPTATELAAKAGFDIVIIDSEHAPIDRTLALAHIRAAAGSGIVPLVRVLDTSDSTIQSFLDLGAAGLVMPKVETAEQASRLVRASRYAPEGLRGMCHACRDGQFVLEGFSGRMERRNRDVLTIPLIESRRALENVHSIAEVEGIDLLFFGPGDMSADMGIDLFAEPEKIKAAWIEFREACHSAGKLTLCPASLGLDGSDLYTAGVDLLVLYAGLRQVVESHRSQHISASA